MHDTQAQRERERKIGHTDKKKGVNRADDE